MSSLKKANIQIRINATRGDFWKVIHDDFAKIEKLYKRLGVSESFSSKIAA